MKIMKRKIYILFIAILAVCLTGCSKAKEISVTSCELVSLSPSGLKSIDGTVAVGIHNPDVRVQGHEHFRRRLLQRR